MRSRRVNIGDWWKDIAILGMLLIIAAAVLIPIGDLVPVGLQQVGRWPFRIAPTVSTSITDLVILSVVSIAVPPLLVASWKQFRSSRRPAQFILELFKDASEGKFSQDEMLSITMDAWQRLTDDVSRIRHRVEDHRKIDDMMTFAPLPNEVKLEMEKKLVNATEGKRQNWEQDPVWRSFF